MKILHLDIETYPNILPSWGLWNQNHSPDHIIDHGYTMCWASKWHGEKKVEFRSVHHDGKEVMVERMHELLSEADAVCHYNGEKFDMPMLNTEFLLQGMPPPDPYHQIDLLRVVRKRFKFPSNKLDYVSQRMGYDGKVNHKGMELWMECGRGEEKAWNVMKKYNIQDVKLLEWIYIDLLAWIQQHPNHALYFDTERPTCPNCGSVHVIKKGVETTKTMQYQRYRCADCGTPLRGRFTTVNRDKRKHILTQSKL